MANDALLRASLPHQSPLLDKSKLSNLPAFSPIEECTEHEDFIAGFEKFNEDVKGYLATADKKFSSVTSRRLPGRAGLRETAAALRRKAAQQAQSPQKIE